MRFLFRLVVLALAAVGVKYIYDRLAPRRDDLRDAGSDFVSRAKTAAGEVAERATEAAQRVASSAQENAAAVKATALEQANEVRSAANDARREAGDVLSSSDADEAVSSSGVSA